VDCLSHFDEEESDEEKLRQLLETVEDSVERKNG